MPPTVHNGDVDHRPLETVLPFQDLPVAPIAIQGYRTPSSSDSSELFAVNILITPSFGMLRTLSENSQTSGNTTTENGSINR